MDSEEEFSGSRIPKYQVYMAQKDKTFCEHEYFMSELDYAMG